MNKPVTGSATAATAAKINQPIQRPAQAPISKPATVAAAKVDGETDVVGGAQIATPPAPAQALSEEVTPLTDAPIVSATEVITAKGTYITIVGDTSDSSHVIGMWDTALTVSGAMVFTPPTVDNKSDPSELELGDFAVNVKIRKSHYLIVIVNESGEVPVFMFPWIDFAFARGKKVIFDQPIIPFDAITTFQTNGLIRELKGYMVSREGFQGYTKGKLD